MTTTTEPITIQLPNALTYVVRWLAEHGEPEYAAVVKQAVDALVAAQGLAEALRNLLVASDEEHDASHGPSTHFAIERHRNAKVGLATAREAARAALRKAGLE